MKTAFWNKRKVLGLPFFRKDLKDLKLSEEKPLIYDNVSQVFGIIPHAYFTYGDTVHCVGVPNPPTADIIAHEKLHIKQQQEAGGPDLWWGKFLREPEFRVDQEAKAYARQ